MSTDNILLYTTLVNTITQMICSNITYLLGYIPDIIKIMGILVGIRYYPVNDRRQVLAISKGLKNRCSELMNGENPGGLFFGKYYFGRLTESGSDHNKRINMWIVCSEKKYAKLTCNEDINMNIEKKISIKSWYPSGNKHWTDWLALNMDVTDYEPMKNQRDLIDKVIHKFNEKNRCVAFIDGDPGVGKSLLGPLLAKELKGSYTNDYNPTEAGLIFSDLYNTVDSRGGPLIVVLDEIDVIINKIHNNKIKDHKIARTDIKNKESWNTFFDKIDRGYYKNIIIIMTSNTPKEIIDKMDKSLLREGRINLVETLIKETKVKDDVFL